jgi:hypothetical protein
MTYEESSVRDKIMELYLKYGEREFDYVIGLGWFILHDAGLLVGCEGKVGCEGNTKLTPEALKLIGKET